MEGYSGVCEWMLSSVSLGIRGKHEDMSVNPAEILSDVSDANNPSPNPASMGNGEISNPSTLRRVTGRADPIFRMMDVSRL